jgi:MFS family permease
LREDLKLTGYQFSWAISLFYFGQLCSEYPAAYLLSRLPVIVFVSFTIVAWGAAEMCLGAVHSFGGLGAVRFFLGFAEGSVQPAFIIIITTSHWYKRREHPIRVATWVSMSGVSQILGALIMYAIGSRDMAIASWRVLFFVIGGMTCVCGIGFILLMPRNPAAHGSSTSARANSLPSASPSIVLPETGPNSTMLS